MFAVSTFLVLFITKSELRIFNIATHLFILFYKGAIMWELFRDRALQVGTLVVSLYITGFHPVQQFMVFRFSHLNEVDVAFNSLILVYGVLIFSGFVTPIINASLGLRRSIILSGFGYLFFLVSVAWGEVTTIYVASVVLGILGGLLWASFYPYLGLITPPGYSRRYSGYYYFVFSIMNGGAMAFMGYFKTFLTYEQTFWIFASICGLGILLAFFLPEKKMEKKAGEKENRNANKKVVFPLMNWPTLVMCMPQFVGFLVYGYIITGMPLGVKTLIENEAYVGYLSIPFYLLPALISFKIGVWADRPGGFERMSWVMGGVSIGGLVLMYWASDFLELFLVMSFITFGYSVVRVLTGALPRTLFPNEKNSGLYERLSGTMVVLMGIGTLISVFLSRYAPLDFVPLIVAGIVFFSFLALALLIRRGMRDVRRVLNEVNGLGV